MKWAAQRGKWNAVAHDGNVDEVERCDYDVQERGSVQTIDDSTGRAAAMRTFVNYLVVLLCCPLLSWFQPVSGSQGDSLDGEMVFALQIRSTTSSELFGKKSRSEGTEALRYRLKRVGTETTVSFDEIAIQRSDLSVHMTRDKFIDRAKGEIFLRTADTTPKEIKAILHDTFDSPICQLELDKLGGEVRRTLVAGPGAKALLERGLLVHALFFHVRFPPGDRWEGNNEIGLGKGLFAKGTLTYNTCGEGQAAGRTKVQVSGKLTFTGKTFISRASAEINGEQTFDHVSRQWVSGVMDVTMISHYDLEGREIGFVENRLKIMMNALPVAKKPKK